MFILSARMMQILEVGVLLKDIIIYIGAHSLFHFCLINNHLLCAQPRKSLHSYNV